MATKTFKIGLSATDKQNMAQDIYEEVLALTFAEYDSSKTYNTGDFVVYENALYQCKADNTTGTWDATKWESATLQDLLDDVEDAVASVSGKANIIDLESGTLVVAKSLTSKQLENVSDESGSTQDAPFNFQATGTDNNTTETPTAPVAKHLELRGNTVAWNQLINNSLTSGTYNELTVVVDGGKIKVNGTSNGLTTLYICANATSNQINLISGHKYLLKGLWKIDGSGTTYDIRVGNHTLYSEQIISETTSQTADVYLVIRSGASVDFEIMPQLIDLTLLGKEYDSVLAFNRDYPLPYYSYNAGELKSANSGKLITIGCNAFDKSLATDNKRVNDLDGTTATLNGVFISDYIRVVSGQDYIISGILGLGTYTSKLCAFYDANKNYISGVGSITNTDEYKVISVPNNAHFVVFNGLIANKDTTMFRLYWNEAHDFVEYVKHEYTLPAVSLKSAGNAYDELKADGTLIARVGYIKASDLTWVDYSGHIVSSTIASLIKSIASNNIKVNLIFNKYITASYDSNTAKSISQTTNGWLNIFDSDLTASTFASGLTDNDYIYYELATPTETTDETKAFTENIEVDDFGTMEFVPASGNVESASNPIVPQGNQFFYPADYVLLIDDLNNYLNENDADTTDLVLRKELLPRLASNSEDGTYTLKATKSGSTITYAWVKDE